jgi:hypothetical protein
MNTLSWIAVIFASNVICLIIGFLVGDLYALWKELWRDQNRDEENPFAPRH